MTKLTIMQHSSHHPSWISIVRDAVEDWRKQSGWSRETAAQMIAEAHHRQGLDRASGITFDPPSRDAYTRMKTNADRIFRWLDEVTKDTNLLPANFILSILAALPFDLRMHTVNKMLWPVELGCRPIEAACSARPLALLQAMLAEAADAESAVAALLDGIDPGELETAHQQLTEAVTAFTRARDTVESLIKGEQHV